jgi:hypothetical protein
MRRAYTIVEMLVAFLLGTVVLGLLWSFFSPEQRRFRSDQSRLSGVQGVLQLDEALAWDIERIALALPNARPTFTIDVPVVITEGRRLEMRIFAPDEPGLLNVKVEPVIYEYDPATGTVTRTGGGSTRRFPGLIARDLQWSLVRLEQAGDGATPDQPLHAVKYVVTCYSEELRDTDARIRKDHELVTLAGAVALPFRSERMFHTYWRSSKIESLETSP